MRYRANAKVFSKSGEELGQVNYIVKARNRADAKRKVGRLMKARPRKRNFESSYSKAASLGYPYIRGEGKVYRGKTWLNRFTKTSSGEGPAVYVGWDDKNRKWIIKHAKK